MKKFSTILLALGLALAPLSAGAQPSDPSTLGPRCFQAPNLGCSWGDTYTGTHDFSGATVVLPDGSISLSYLNGACPDGQFITQASGVAICAAGTAHGNGANCSPGFYPLGVDAGGAVEDCTAVPADTDTTCLDGTVNCLFAGSATEGGSATTALALAADPTACDPGEFVTDVAADGTLTCAAASASDTTCLDAGVVCAFAGSATEGGPATTALALDTNPQDCGANTFATTIGANGDLTCAALTDADIPDTITASNYLPLAGGTVTGDVSIDDNTGDSPKVCFKDATNRNTCLYSEDATGRSYIEREVSPGQFYFLNLAVLSSLGFTGDLTGNVIGNADTATALAVDPTACDPGDFVTDIAADGTLTCATPPSGGSNIVLDLADDASNESTALGEIATTGDTNGIFTEPSPDKLLIAVGSNWPTADTADALSVNPQDCGANTFATTIAANGDLTCAALTDADVPNALTLAAATIGTSDITLKLGTTPTVEGRIEWDGDTDTIRVGGGGGTSIFFEGPHYTTSNFSTDFGTKTCGDLSGCVVGAITQVDDITDIVSGVKTGIDLKLVTGTAGTGGHCAQWDANGDLVSAGAPCGTGSGGEANTASNVGGGLANFNQKTGVDLEFNTFAAADFDLASNLLTIDDTKWATDAQVTSAIAAVDHSIYPLLDGTRPFTGDQRFNPGDNAVALHVTNTAGDSINLFQGTTAASLTATETAGTDNVLSFKVTGDTPSRFVVDANGKMSWGDGTNAVDSTLARTAADHLDTPDILTFGTNSGVATGGASGATFFVDASSVATGLTNIQLREQGTTRAIWQAYGQSHATTPNSVVFGTPAGSTATLKLATGSSVPISMANGIATINSSSLVSGANGVVFSLDGVQGTDTSSIFHLKQGGANGGFMQYRHTANSVDPNTVRYGCNTANCKTQLRVGANLLAMECDGTRKCAFSGDTLVVDPVAGTVSVNGDDVCTASGANCPLAGLGDMLKIVYDTDADSVVDDSELTDAVKVGSLDCSTKAAGFVRVVSGVPTICVPGS